MLIVQSVGAVEYADYTSLERHYAWPGVVIRKTERRDTADWMIYKEGSDQQNWMALASL